MNSNAKQMKPGDKVRYIGPSEHPSAPAVGALGTVMRIVPAANVGVGDYVHGWPEIAWDEPRTSFNFLRPDQVEVVVANS